MLENHQPIFILGSPRSGTTMLQVLLGNHPQVASTVELTLFNRYVAPWLETWEEEQRGIAEQGWGVGLPLLWDREAFRAVLGEFLERAYTRLLEKHPAATHVLDKHPGYSMHAPLIKAYLPRAKFLHIIRDGRDVACSLVAAKESMGFGVESHAEAGTLWRQMVLGAREAARFSGDYLELRYERFLTEPEAAYREALQFCGLPCDAQWLQQTMAENTFDKMKERRATADRSVQVSAHHYRTGRSGNWKADFTPATRYAFDLAAGELLRELGYDTGRWWAFTPWEECWLPIRHRLARRATAVREAALWLHAAITLQGMKRCRRRASA